MREISPGVFYEGPVLSEETPKPVPVTIERQRMSLVSPKPKALVQRLADVEVPDSFYDRIKSGIPMVDLSFGGEELPGFMPGSSILLSGDPGVGKTTIMLMIADAIAENTGRVAMIASLEEDPRIMKMKAKRLGMKGNFLITPTSEYEALLSEIRSNGVEVLVVDSVNVLTVGDLDNDKAATEACQRFDKMAHEEMVLTFLLSHVTKGGVFSGSNKKKHVTDVHAHFSLDRETGVRTLNLEKNRFGPSFVPWTVEMTPKGLDLKKQVDAGGGAVSKSRKDGIEQIIREKLLAGHKVSGYCFSRFNADCSGNYWRTAVDGVKQKMTAEGYKLAETSMNRRTHLYVETLPDGTQVTQVE